MRSKIVKWLPVVNESDVSGGGRGGGSQITHKAEDLRRQGGKLAVLDEVAQVEQRHLLLEKKKQEQQRELHEDDGFEGLKYIFCEKTNTRTEWEDSWEM